MARKVNADRYLPPMICQSASGDASKRTIVLVCFSSANQTHRQQNRCDRRRSEAEVEKVAKDFERVTRLFRHRERVEEQASIIRMTAATM